MCLPDLLWRFLRNRFSVKGPPALAQVRPLGPPHPQLDPLASPGHPASLELLGAILSPPSPLSPHTGSCDSWPPSQVYAAPEYSPLRPYVVLSASYVKSPCCSALGGSPDPFTLQRCRPRLRTSPNECYPPPPQPPSPPPLHLGFRCPFRQPRTLSQSQPSP